MAGVAGVLSVLVLALWAVALLWLFVMLIAAVLDLFKRDEPDPESVYGVDYSSDLYHAYLLGRAHQNEEKEWKEVN